jgi:argininosuccinate lyase
MEKGCELDGLSLDELKEIRPEFDAGFYDALRLTSVLAHHDVPGGTAPKRVKQALDSAKEQLATMREGHYAHA